MHVSSKQSNLSGLLLLLLANAGIQVGNDPAEQEQHEEAATESQGLPELRGWRVLVSDKKVTLTKLIDDVDSNEVQGGAADVIL